MQNVQQRKQQSSLSYNPIWYHTMEKLRTHSNDIKSDFPKVMSDSKYGTRHKKQTEKAIPEPISAAKNRRSMYRKVGNGFSNLTISSTRMEIPAIESSSLNKRQT